VCEYDDFRLKNDATGKLGFTFYKKCTAAVRTLAYGVAGDLVDQYMSMSESTCLESMYKFCRVMVLIFVREYLRDQMLLTMSLEDFLVCLIV
jgi:hypothetical protein